MSGSMASAEPFGDRLKRLRLARGMKQSALAEACGWAGNQSVSNLESRRRVPSHETVARLARAMGYTEAEIRGDIEPDTTQSTTNNVQQNDTQNVPEITGTSARTDDEVEPPAAKEVSPVFDDPLFAAAATLWKTATPAQRREAIHALSSATSAPRPAVLSSTRGRGLLPAKGATSTRASG